MSEADATVKTGSERIPEIVASERGMTTRSNAATLAVDANLIRKPDYFVYVFNIGEKSHRLSSGHVKNFYVAGCPVGQRYVHVMKLPNIVNQTFLDASSEQLRIAGDDGRRVAMDIINAANLTLNQDLEIDPNSVVSEGADYSKWGLFWSLNEVPTEDELLAAKRRVEKHYRALIAQADEWTRKNKQELIREDHHIAANYFRYEGVWNTRVALPESCPVCGGGMMKGVAVHGGANGCGAVLDWDKAIAAGLKTEKDRPRVKSEAA